MIGEKILNDKVERLPAIGRVSVDNELVRRGHNGGNKEFLATLNSHKVGSVLDLFRKSVHPKAEPQHEAVLRLTFLKNSLGSPEELTRGLVCRSAHSHSSLLRKTHPYRVDGLPDRDFLITGAG